MPPITYMMYCSNCGKLHTDVIPNVTVTCECKCTTTLTETPDGYITLKVK